MILKDITTCRPMSLRTFCEAADLRLSLERGSALMLVRHLLFTKALRTDMSVPLSDKLSVNALHGNEPTQARSIRQ